MEFPSISLGVAVLLSIVYGALAIRAHAHVDKGKMIKASPSLLALTAWWPFYDMYDDVGTRLCVYGRFLLPIIAGGYIYWGLSG